MYLHRFLIVWAHYPNIKYKGKDKSGDSVKIDTDF